jgi:hypothetical protein
MDHRGCSFRKRKKRPPLPVDWPDAIENHGLAVANAAMVLAPMRWRRRRQRRRRSVDDDDVQTIVLPPYTRRRYTLPRIFGELAMDDDDDDDDGGRRESKRRNAA